MSLYEDRHPEDGERRNDREPKGSAGAHDHLGRESFNLGEIGQRYRADRATLRVIDSIVESPTELPFAQVKKIVEYLQGEPFADRLPGPVRIDHRFILDPKPVETCAGTVFEGHRLHVERSIYDPEIIIKVALNPHFIQFDAGTRLTNTLLDQSIREKNVADQLIRIPVGHALEIERAVLDHRHFHLRTVAEVGALKYRQISEVRIGTPASLGLFNFPGRILMIDSRDAHATPLGNLVGTWHDEVGVYVEGVHLKAQFTRTPGFFRDRSVILRNGGEIPFFVSLELSRRM